MTSGVVLVEQDVWVKATPATVYAYLTDPSLVVRWMGRHIELDPVPGGLFCGEMNDRDQFRGEFIELIPDTRVVVTFGWVAEGAAFPPGSTTLELSLEAESDGTRVRLVHSGVPETAANDHNKGWRMYLDRLAIAAVGGDPGPDPAGAA